MTGYYPSPDASNCVVCDSTCQICNGGSASSCLSCLTNAQLSGTSPNTCICDSEHYPNPTAASCSACSSACTTCNGSSTTSCTSCGTNQTLQANNSCACSAGYYNTSAFCYKCDPTCATCNGPLAINCLTCTTLQTFISSNNSCFSTLYIIALVFASAIVLIGLTVGVIYQFRRLRERELLNHTDSPSPESQERQDEIHNLILELNFRVPREITEFEILNNEDNNQNYEDG